MFRFLPWKFIVRRAAHAFGFMDPATWLARLRRFAQPSEVQEPVELLRAGILFHARGLVNTKAIQHNLDWVWPYWVARQFDPKDVSFLPRAFSFSHINLTHRNWTAVGRPDMSLYPLVDPRGLVTPFYDGWSLDFWVITESDRRLLPSRELEAEQEWELEGNLAVRTSCRKDDLAIEHRVWLEVSKGVPCAHVRVRAEAGEPAWLAVAVRPVNPEGVQFVDHIRMEDNGQHVYVNDEDLVELDTPVDGYRSSAYEKGDVYRDLPRGSEESEVRCPVGMATGAALYHIDGGDGTSRTIEIRVPLKREVNKLGVSKQALERTAEDAWTEALNGLATLEIPHQRHQFLYDAAVRSMLLLYGGGEIVPGPYTYCRFWFRDACLMLHSLLTIGAVDLVKKELETFPRRQTVLGYYRSQEGEWDSNGQVLWIAARFEALTHQKLSYDLIQSLRKGGRWIHRKRLSKTSGQPEAGLLPAGFSAEHLGTNDFYYWDDFWAVGGLHHAAEMMDALGDGETAAEMRNEALDLLACIEQSLSRIPKERCHGAIPAAPSRRMDSGAVGSLVADYPLQILGKDDERINGTLEYLLRRSFHEDGFFQDMIHSGTNAYLTLDIAQSFLRRGDARFAKLMRHVADIATSTGQWPEAIHPHTGGGCMGDGHHGWAAAEWVMMIRNCFVREEPGEDRLIIGSGILPEWMEPGNRLSYGPTLTPWGPVTVIVEPLGNGENGKEEGPRVRLVAEWRGNPPIVEVALPHHRKQSIPQPDAQSILTLQPLGR